MQAQAYGRNTKSSQRGEVSITAEMMAIVQTLARMRRIRGPEATSHAALSVHSASRHGANA